jgi:ribosomal protein L23
MTASERPNLTRLMTVWIIGNDAEAARKAIEVLYGVKVSVVSVTLPPAGERANRMTIRATGQEPRLDAIEKDWTWDR